MGFENFFKNKKAVIKISSIVLLLIAVTFLILFASGVFAGTHTSSASLEPEWSQPGITNDYTVEICNDGPDTVDEVRIYRNMDYTNFICEEEPGWELQFISTKKACHYIAESSDEHIEAGECETFNFSATAPSEDPEECLLIWKFETRDLNDMWLTINDTTSIDSHAPNTTKILGEPKKVDGNLEWINGVTLITLSAVDTEECGIGVDKTYYKNVLALDILEEKGLDWDCEEDPCRDINLCESLVQYVNYNDTDWSVYNEPFSKKDESCHILYYYSEDKIGNKEVIKTNCFFVDKTPPIINKTVGEPKIRGDGQTFDWWVRDHVTPITLDCQDQGPHPSGDEEVCYKVSYDLPIEGTDITNQYCDEEELELIGQEGYNGEWCCVDAPEDIIFKEDSLHNLEYFCRDAVDKKSPIDLEWFKVDSQPPIITKEMIGGDHSRDCPPNLEGDVCYVRDDGENGVAISVKDDTTYPECAVDNVTCSYELWWETDLETCIEEFGGTHLYNPDTSQCFVEGGLFNDYQEILFHEDSTHTLKIHCEDALGNSDDDDEEEFLVDSTPPETTKWYEGPQYPNPIIEGDTPYPHWINSQTLVYLNATDEKIGVDKIYWRNTLVDNKYCWTYDSGDCINAEGSGDFNEYIAPFNKSEQSCHLIEFYAVDKLGNEEVHKKQCVFVDNTAPLTGKIIGEPKEIIDEDTYISQGTPINLTCIDQEPHPVDHSSLWYRYRFSEDCDDLEQAEWTDWIDPQQEIIIDGNNNLIEKTIYFPEDSCHELEYYCVDALGNEEEHQFEIDIVDTQAPIIEKEIIGPWLECDEEVIDHNSPGDNLRQITGEYSQPCSINTGLAFDGTNLLVTCWYHNTIDVLSPADGSLVGTINVSGYDGLNAIAWDATRNKLWTCAEHNKVLLVDTSDGSSTFMFTATDQCTDGLAYDGKDDTLYTSGDVHTGLYHYHTNGTLIEILDMTGKLGGYGNSGIAVGGDKLYLANDGGSQIYEASKDLSSSILFATFPERLEDMECDDITFAAQGVGAIWSQDAYDRIINAYEIPAGQCGFGGLPPEPKEDCFIIDGVTNISVTAEDPEPHPVNGVNCNWDYNVLDGDKLGQGEEGLIPPFIIHFPEESTHILTITCRDALGNEVRDVEKFIVDKTAPTTTKTYGTPFYSENGAEWINSQTQIYLKAEDTGAHKSGIKEINYRYSLVDDEYCTNRDLCQQGIQTDKEYDKASPILYGNYDVNFTIPQESCHLIEYYSVDNVDKTEDVKRQCVFVDNTPPEPVKTVGEPKTKWDGKDSVFYKDETKNCWIDGEGRIECWKVTLDTEIDMSCIDPQPHPVDHEKICFNVGLDADDATEIYCREYNGEYNKTGDGFCCLDQTIEDFTFLESSEHNLKFYCVDALGNTNKKVDEEKFKVDGEDFRIKLNKKWNLISTPVVLLNDDISEVFENIESDIESVWAYDPLGELCDSEDGWCVYSPDEDSPDNLLKTMQPGWGYWVLALNDTELVIGGSLLAPGRTPPNRNLIPGWNLIGYYGTEGLDMYDGPDGDGRDAYCALYSLTSGELGLAKWNALYGYWELYNPQFEGYNIWDNLDPGAGYWVSMKDNQQNYIYSPSTVCDGWLGGWFP